MNRFIQTTCIAFGILGLGLLILADPRWLRAVGGMMFLVTLLDIKDDIVEKRRIK